MTPQMFIFDMFKDGTRIKLKSFKDWSDYNVYKDCLLVRIYYVHKHKPAQNLDIIAQDLMDYFGYDERTSIELIVDFINDFPDFWDFRESDQDHSAYF